MICSKYCLPVAVLAVAVLATVSASSGHRSLMQSASSQPTSGSACYQSIGSLCCGFSPGLPSATCQKYSGVIYNQTFVSDSTGCIWPLAIQCSLISPLSNTTVGLYTLNFADPPSSAAAILADIPLCNSTYTNDMTAAYQANKLTATANANVASIAKNAGAILGGGT